MSKVIFVNGTFDVLTVGHFCLLEYAKSFMAIMDEDRLVVAIDSDEKISKDKGNNRPIFSEDERKAALNLLCRDVNSEIHIFNSNEELYEMIKLCKADIIVKGSDWKGNVIGSDLAEVKLFDRMEEYSSTKTIERILEKNR